MRTRSAISGVLALVAGLAVYLVFSTAAATPDVPDAAFAEGAHDEGNPRVTKRLLVDARQVRPGDTFTAGVLFEMDPQWHVYWRDSGEGGMATEMIFEAEGAQAGPTLWPEPEVFHEAGGSIITFGYGETVLLFSEIEVPEDADGSVEVVARPDYLVCRVDCIPGNAELRRTVDVAEAHLEADDAARRLFSVARQAVPRTAGEAGVDTSVRYSHAPIEPSDEFRIEISAIGCETSDQSDCVRLGEAPDRAPDAFVYDGIETAELEVARVGPHPEAESGWLVEVTGRTSRDEPPGDGRLDGVLRLRGADGEPLPVAVDELFPRTDSEQAQSLVGASGPDSAETTEDDGGEDDESRLHLAFVLLLAFFGGALLNLMPCVFPVLAVKVFSFLNVVQENRESIRLHGAMYTAGIVASMLALAGAVIGLKMVGTRVGWGFQFQEPLFVALVGAVVVVFALNLFGVFEVSLDPGRLEEVTEAEVGPRRSFGEGVLAVVLATPCSAPFLGTAVGFALASPPWMIALIFAVLGLGLAAPFVVLTLAPGLKRFLPRPGPWMSHFKQFLGFALLGTAVWLLWVIGQMAGVDGVIRLLAFFLAAAVGAWLYGLVQFGSRRARYLGLIAAVGLVVATGVVSLRFDEVATETSDDGSIAWQQWSRQAVQTELEAGRPVFVDFTADWCITCKTNEARVIETDGIARITGEHDVAMFKADWTQRDDRIRSRLQDFGKGGVPLYLVYDPREPDEPEVLPELLTHQRLSTALEDAAP